jgi:small subunit ribosomal protein S6e
MAVFKIVVSDPESRKSYQLEVDQGKAGLIGKRIGEQFDAASIGLPGYTLEIRGGTDKDGFPMHPSVHGPGRKKVLLAHPPCFRPRLKGQRKRKTVHGNTISPDIVQVNVKIIKKGEKPLEQLIPTKPKEKVEKPKEKPEAKLKEKPKKEEKPKEKPEEKPVKEVKEKGGGKG